MSIEILYCVLLLIIFFVALVYVVISNVLKNKKNSELSSTEATDVMEIVEVTLREFNMYAKESAAMHKYNSPVSERPFPEILSEGVKKAKRDQFKINDKVVEGSGYYREL